MPVLRTAKNVKIYDRYIGRSMVRRGFGFVGVAPGYKRSLEWIVSVFKTLGGASRGGVFEIYCGVDAAAISTKFRPQLRIEAAKLEAALKSILGANVQVTLKEESKAAQCPHGRYLITDQVAVLVERGFDLLWDDNAMTAAGLNPLASSRPIRDVAIVRCEEYRAVEAHTKMLPPY
jgi:hypothetical protein